MADKQVFKISTEVQVRDNKVAERLALELLEVGADTHVGKKFNKWTVFAEYETGIADHVGRCIAPYD